MKCRTPSIHWFMPRSQRKGRGYGIGPRGSQTPGVKKGVCCSLMPIGGLPRKAWIRARAYKLRNYSLWCEFSTREGNR